MSLSGESGASAAGVGGSPSGGRRSQSVADEGPRSMPIRASPTSHVVSPVSPGGTRPPPPLDSPRMGFDATLSPRLTTLARVPRSFDLSFEAGVTKRTAAAHVLIQTDRWALGASSDRKRGGSRLLSASEGSGGLSVAVAVGGGVGGVEVVARCPRQSDDAARLSYKAGDVFRVVQQVRDDEWQMTNGTRTGIATMLDFDALQPAEPADDLLTGVLSGSPLWCNAVVRGLLPSVRRSFVCSYLAAFEQVGEALNLLKHVCSFEVAAAEDASRLFCQGSLMELLWWNETLRSCRRFLSGALQPTFNLLLALDLEVDPTKLAPGVTVAKAVAKVARVVADICERVRVQGPVTFPVMPRLLLRHAELEVAAKFGPAVAMDCVQRLVFGLLVVGLQEDHGGMTPVSPEIDWRRSRATVSEVLRSVSFSWASRRFLAVEMDAHRAGLRDNMVVAARAILGGVPGRLSSAHASVVEKLGRGAADAAQGRVSRTWWSLHRGLSLSRDRVAAALAEVEGDETCDVRKFRAMLERMGPPRYAGPSDGPLPPNGGAGGGGVTAAGGATVAAGSGVGAAGSLTGSFDGGAGASGVGVGAAGSVGSSSCSTTPRGRNMSTSSTTPRSGRSSSASVIPDVAAALATELDVVAALNVAQRLAAYEGGEELSLASCGLREVPDLLCMTAVTRLNLSSNQIPEISSTLVQMTQLRELDLSNNLIEKLPFRGLVGMPHLSHLDLSGNPLPQPLNYIASGVAAAETVFFLKHVEEFILVYRASTGDVEADDSDYWQSVERVLRALPAQYLVQWNTFAVDYVLSSAGRSASSKNSTPLFNRLLLKRQTSSPGGAGGGASMLSARLLTFGSGPNDMVPVSKRVRQTVTVTNTTPNRLTFVCHAPSTPVAKVSCEPAEFVLAKGKAATVDVWVEYLATTTMQECVRISLEPLGMSLFVILTGQSDVSFEIDHRELQLGEKVGAGGAASVFRGTWRGKEVACKRVMGDPTAEARLLCQLHHPNVLVFYGIARQDGFSTLVTEFVQLGSLHRVLGDASVPLPSWLRAKFALDTARAVAYIHSRDVIHRDLKSSNLLVNSLASHEECNIKLCDFGTARGVDHSMTRAQGTTFWMAPEVFHKMPYSTKADIWSFGIILGEILTRKEPFAELSFFDAVSMVGKGSVPDVPDAPEPLRALRASCLMLDPEARPTAAGLVAALQRESSAPGRLRMPTLGRAVMLHSRNNAAPSDGEGAHARPVSGEALQELIESLDAAGVVEEGTAQDEEDVKADG